MNSLQNIYEEHHEKRRSDSFVLLEKERAEFFSKNVGTGKKVLDIGCRDGALTKYFTEGNTVTGFDIDVKSLERAKERYGIEGKQVDLNDQWHTGYQEQFDAVVAGEVLEHVYHPDEVIKKAASVLKEGGVFVGSVPNAFSLKNRIRLLFGTKKGTPLSDPTHINHFHCSELKGYLEEHFTEVTVTGLGRYKHLAKIHPGFFAYDLVFIAKR
jgi:2-polyprenyl-3-methyl-5-hydroxy-6-metoxy-1,4-benzoquinol methylase